MVIYMDDNTLKQDLKAVSDLAKSKLEVFGIKTWDDLEELLG
jgi:hypothetical protein